MSKCGWTDPSAPGGATCNLPTGHDNNGWHEETRDGKIWAQWRGGEPPKSEVDWPGLWEAFRPEDGLTWGQLDPASRGYFKTLYLSAVLPVLVNIVQHVALYDRYQKAERN